MRGPGVYGIDLDVMINLNIDPQYISGYNANCDGTGQCELDHKMKK